MRRMACYRDGSSSVMSIVVIEAPYDAPTHAVQAQNTKAAMQLRHTLLRSMGLPHHQGISHKVLPLWEMATVMRDPRRSLLRPVIRLRKRPGPVSKKQYFIVGANRPDFQTTAIHCRIYSGKAADCRVVLLRLHGRRKMQAFHYGLYNCGGDRGGAQIIGNPG